MHPIDVILHKRDGLTLSTDEIEFFIRATVDHTVTDQTSILRFIEDNWLGGQRITGSFDTLAGRLNPMFDFKNPDNTPLILNTSTGQPTN